MTAVGLVVAAGQALSVVAGAPLLVGLMRKVRARMEGRDGPPLTQPWRDLRKLAGKERIVPRTTSWVFWLAPLVLIATAGVVAGILPLLTTRSATCSPSCTCCCWAPCSWPWPDLTRGRPLGVWGPAGR
jgi:formate hydrogenlyase subunit 4